MSTNQKVGTGIILLVVIILGFIFLGGDDSRRAKETIVLTEDGRDANLLDYEPQVIAQEDGRSPLSGRVCDAWNKRPFAVMYTGDASARKWFTNLSKAEIVVEMPHRSIHGGTRVMGIFQCETPDIVGPMRSGRVDFLGLANAFDAIFVPWGGSSVMKNLLAKGVNDHIDCNGEVAPGGGDACFRRSGGPSSRMDKASSSVPKLIEVAQKQGYRNTTKFDGLRFQTDIPRSQRPEYGRIKVYFEKPFRVEFEYDPETNSYKRFFNKKIDKDYATGQQYEAKNVVVILAKKNGFSTDEDYIGKGLRDPWDGVDKVHRKNDSGQYPNMELGDPWFDVQRSGKAYYYMNGREIVGMWKRERALDAPMQFLDDQGNPIHFVEGSIWIEVPESNRRVKYKTERDTQDDAPEETTTQ